MPPCPLGQRQAQAASPVISYNVHERCKMSRFRRSRRNGVGNGIPRLAGVAAKLVWDNRERIIDAATTAAAGAVAAIEGRGKGSRTVPADLRRAIIARDESRCAYCGKKVWGSYREIDHKQPWSKRGKTVYENLQVTCRPCNKEKGDMTDREYRRLLQRQKWAGR